MTVTTYILTALAVAAAAGLVSGLAAGLPGRAWAAPLLISFAAAFAAMWRAIPMLRPLGLLARNGTALRLLERAYLGFLVVRPRLQAALRGRQAGERGR